MSAARLDQRTAIRARPLARPRLFRSWFGPSQPFWGFLFVLPILLLFTAFKLWPILYAVWLSFTNTSTVARTSDFVGLANYLTLARDPQFLRALTVTGYYVFGT